MKITQFLKKICPKLIKENLPKLFRLGCLINKDFYERLLALSLVKNNFDGLKTAKVFPTREDLWASIVCDHDHKNNRIIYLEFGVFQGYSIRYFAQHNSNPNSIFIGLDTFEGLPEDWLQHKQGAFSTNGKVPECNDERVFFITGLFQETWFKLLKNLPHISELNNLVVHFDADLYTSTLFVLAKLDELKVAYVAIFDEFTGDESRALYNYSKSYRVKLEFLGKTRPVDYPTQVACRIIPWSS
jgi:O-methyltransferase